MARDDGRGQAAAAPPRRLVDYYAFFGVRRGAPTAQIVEAYLAKIQDGDAPAIERAERALAILSDPARRAAYDRDLAAGRGTAGAPLAAARTAGPGQVRVRPAHTAPQRAATPVPANRVVTINGIWALAALALVGIVAGVLFLNRGASPAGGGGGSGSQFNSAILNRLEPQAAIAPLGPDGVQTLDLVVNGDTMSYRPAVIKVKAGVPVRFNLSIEGRDPG